MKTSEVLNTAADLIEQRGWGRGSSTWNISYAQGAPVCLEGGIQAAMGIFWDRTDSFPGYCDRREHPDYSPVLAFQTCPAYVAVANYLNTDECLYSFNDKSCMEDVIATLRATAVIEAAKEEAEQKAEVLV